MRTKRLTFSLLVALVMVGLLGCAGLLSLGGEIDLRIVSVSEIKSLDPLSQRCFKRQSYNIEITYLGSVDMMLGMEQESLFSKQPNAALSSTS